MKEVNVQPNPAVPALVSGRTNLIGLIVPDLVHPFFAQVAKRISAKLRAQVYSLIISSSEDDPGMDGEKNIRCWPAESMPLFWLRPGRASRAY
jgi:LacI family transcriptional regulator